MKNLSIKWKLTISFVVLGLTLVGLYVFMATETFESDKISYIYDSEQIQVDGLLKQIVQRVERVVFDSRSILAGFDFHAKKMNSIAQKLFDQQKDIVAIQIFNQHQGENLLRLEKGAVVWPDVQNEKLKYDGHSLQTDVLAFNDQTFMVMTAEKNLDGDVIVTKILTNFQNLLPKSTTTQFILSQDEKILNLIANEKMKTVAQEIIQELNLDRSEKTLLKEVNGEKFLVSSAPIQMGHLRLTSVMDQKVALGALNVLFKRSIVFVLFSTFATIIISLLLSSGLTKSLQQLTGIAEKISLGDFSATPKSQSNDEVGVLSKAFAKMIHEIQRLLSETKDKARMESELKTARLVQESLFPKKPHFQSGHIEINGLFVTSSECGGDWWYYFERGNYLYVFIADATGHGTPAALITCAARALFSQIERSEIDIQEMAKSWDLCVSNCSNQKVMMTGLILEVDKTSGWVRCINASHELPFLLSKNGDECENEKFEHPDAFQCEPVLLPVGARLGELKNEIYPVHEFQLRPEDKLVLYTDGLLAITNPQGREIGEKRMVKSLEKISPGAQGAADLTNQLFSIFEKHRDNTALPDDVTLVILEWKGQKKNDEKGILEAS